MLLIVGDLEKEDHYSRTSGEEVTEVGVEAEVGGIYWFMVVGYRDRRGKKKNGWMDG